MLRDKMIKYTDRYHNGTDRQPVSSFFARMTAVTGKIIRDIARSILLFAMCVVVISPETAFSQTLTPFYPDDPYFQYNSETLKNYPGQWHLQNQTPADGINGIKGTGIDANLKEAWKMGYTGKGVVIGIVDDGVEGTHEDIKDNYSKDLSRNFSSDATIANQAQGPIGNGDNHGQAVAGVTAARGRNGIGTTGAAPYATIVGLTPYSDGEKTADAVRSLYIQAYYWQSGVNSTTGKITSTPKIHIMNHSYGQSTPWNLVDDLHGSDVTSALNRTGANGIIHVWSAGNERGQANEDTAKDTVLNNRNVIPVAALGSDGKYSDYSNYGYNVFVTAPSGSKTGFEITTTDRSGENLGYNRYSDQNTKGDQSETFPYYNYTSTFSGTSSSAPLVTGILALGKQAQPLLDVRMAKHVLVQTSVKVDATDEEWLKNGAGNWFNPNYGFGLIDAGKFVARAKTVMGVTEQTSVSSGTQIVNKPIAYYDGNTFNGTSAQFTFTTNELTASLRQPLEGVEVALNFTHSSRGNLTAGIASPYSTQSGLFYSTKDLDDAQKDKTGVSNFAWTFLTNAFWGEDALGGSDKTSGTWTLFMGDEVSKTSLGTWNSYNLTLLMGKLIFEKAGTTTQTEDIKARSLSLNNSDSLFINPAGFNLQVSEKIQITSGELNINGRVKLARPDDDDDPDDGWFVLDGGIVSGAGIIDAPYGFYHFSGDLKPGNSIGTLTVNGDYIQDTQGKLIIEIASTTSNDLLAVNGEADLNGILQTSWTGGYTPALKTKFGTFLTASGGVSGQFSSLITNITPTIVFKPQYDVANQVYLMVERDYTNGSLMASLSPNQKSVASMLNSVGNTASGDLNMVLEKIDSLPTNDQAAAAMEQIAPRGDQGQASMFFNALTTQNGQVSDRLNDLRNGVTGFSVQNLSLNVEQDESLNRYGRPILLAYNAEGLPTSSVFKTSVSRNLGFFIRGNGTFGNLKTTSTSSFQNYGIILGGDYRFSQNLAAGILVSYNRGKSDLDSQGSHVKTTNYGIGAYGTCSSRGFYLDVQISYGRIAADKERRIVFPGIDRTAFSDQKGRMWTFAAGGGYLFPLKHWVITPLLSIEYIQLGTEDYTENGADAMNLTVEGSTTTLFQGHVGMRVGYLWKIGETTFIPSVWGTYGHEFERDDQASVTARLAMGSASFTNTIVSPDRDFVNLGMQALLTLPREKSLYINLSGQAGQSNYSAFHIGCGFRMAF